MAGTEDQTGDYGYDLTQEVKAYLATPPQGSPRIVPSTAGLRREPDPDADLGYDAAHEF